MSEFDVSSTQSSSSAPAQPSSANSAAAGNAAQASGAAQGYDKDSKISSVADLRKKAPEVYQKMMEGLAMSIVRRMRRNQERLKKMWRGIHER